MPTLSVTDPQTGSEFSIDYTGTPPSDQEILTAFSGSGKTAPPAPAPHAPAVLKGGDGSYHGDGPASVAPAPRAVGVPGTMKGVDGKDYPVMHYGTSIVYTSPDGRDPFATGGDIADQERKGGGLKVRTFDAATNTTRATTRNQPGQPAQFGSAATGGKLLRDSQIVAKNARAAGVKPRTTFQKVASDSLDLAEKIPQMPDAILDMVEPIAENAQISNIENFEGNPTAADRKAFAQQGAVNNQKIAANVIAAAPLGSGPALAGALDAVKRGDTARANGLIKALPAGAVAYAKAHPVFAALDTLPLWGSLAGKALGVGLNAARDAAAAKAVAGIDAGAMTASDAGKATTLAKPAIPAEPVPAIALAKGTNGKPIIVSKKPAVSGAPTAGSGVFGKTAPAESVAPPVKPVAAAPAEPIEPATAPPGEPVAAHPGAPVFAPGNAAAPLATTGTAGAGGAAKVFTFKPPKAQPNMAASVNLDKMDLSDGQKALVAKSVAGQGLTAGTGMTDAQLQAAARGLGLTIDALDTLQPGHVPPGVLGSVYARGLRELHNQMARASDMAEQTFKADPSPANQAALDQATKNLAKATKYDAAIASDTGGSLGMRARVSSPFAAAETGDIFKPAADSAPTANTRFRTRKLTPGALPGNFGEGNQTFTKSAADAARARILAKQAAAGATPAERLKSYVSDSETGALDTETLGDLTTLGGYYVEGGLRKFADWSKQLAKDIPGLTPADHQVVWNNVRAEAAKRTGAAQSPRTSSDLFVDQLSQKLGRQGAAGFVQHVIDKTGSTDIIDRMVAGKVLTPAEQSLIHDAEVLNTPKRGTGPAPSAGMQALADARTAAKEAQAAVTKAKTARTVTYGAPVAGKNPGTRFKFGPIGPPSPADSLERTFAGPLGKSGAAALRSKLGEEAFGRLAAGTATKDDMLAAVKAHEGIRSVRSKAAPRPGIKPPAEFGETLKAHRSAQAKAAKPPTVRYGLPGSPKPSTGPRMQFGPIGPPSPDDVLTKHLAGRVGNAGATLIKAHLDPATWRKLSSGADLTDQEALSFGRAYDQARAASPRAPGSQSGLSKTVSDTVRSTADAMRQEKANAALSQWQTRKNYVRDALAAKIDDPRKMQAAARDLARLKAGDNKGLGEIWNRHAPKKPGETARQLLQAGYLSSPKTLGVIAASHLAAHGVEEGLVRPIAAAISGGTVPGIDLRASLHSAGVGIKKGVPEAATIMRQGPNALTLGGGNPLWRFDEPLHSEVTLPGGKAAAPINAAARFFPRSHSAVYQIIGRAIFDHGIAEAATLRVRAEMLKTGKGLTAAERHSREAYLRSHPTPDMVEHAREYWAEQMFTNQNAIADLVSRGTNAGGAVGRVLGGAVMPFNRVPANIAGRALEYSGVGGIAKGINFAARRQPLTAAERADLSRSLARGVVGAGLGAGGYALGQRGFVNAPDPKKGEFGSVNVGGRQVAVDRIAPVSNPVLAGAAIQAGHPAGEIAGEFFAENPMARTGELFSDLTSGDQNAGQRTLRNQVSGLVPAGLGAAAAHFDPTHSKRQVNTVGDAIKNRIPGLREQLPVKTDMMGRPIPETNNLDLFPRNQPIQPKSPIETMIEDYYARLDRIKQPIHTTQDLMQRQMDQKIAAQQYRVLKPILQAHMLQKLSK